MSARGRDVGDHARGAEVSWSRDWGESFGDDLMERVEALLARSPGA